MLEDYRRKGAPMSENKGPNNPQFDECKFCFCDDSVGYMCDYHSALAEIGRLKAELKAEDERIKELEELVKKFKGELYT